MQSYKIEFRDKKSSQLKISEVKTTHKYSFLRSRRDSVGDDRPKDGPRDWDNDYKHSCCARKVSDPNIESSFDSERPKMGSGNLFVDLGFFKKIKILN